MDDDAAVFRRRISLLAAGMAFLIGGAGIAAAAMMSFISDSSTLPVITVVFCVPCVIIIALCAYAAGRYLLSHMRIRVDGRGLTFISIAGGERTMPWDAAASVGIIRVGKRGPDAWSLAVRPKRIGTRPVPWALRWGPLPEWWRLTPLGLWRNHCTGLAAEVQRCAGPAWVGEVRPGHEGQ